MSEDISHDVTGILAQLHAGNVDAAHALVERIHKELRRSAAALMKNERPSHTLQPTALVNEALLRLRPQMIRATNRRQLFAAMQQAMQRVLLDHAKARRAKKRSPESPAEPQVEPPFDPQYLDLAEALEELGEIAPRQRAVVEYRYFLGLTVEEVASQLDLSVSQVERDWRLARAWLFKRLGSFA